MGHFKGICVLPATVERILWFNPWKFYLHMGELNDVLQLSFGDHASQLLMRLNLRSMCQVLG